MILQAHQVRVEEERRQLHERLEKLQEFIGISVDGRNVIEGASPMYATLSVAERADLVEQAHAMRVYRDILERRMKRWGGAPQ